MNRIVNIKKLMAKYSDDYSKIFAEIGEPTYYGGWGCCGLYKSPLANPYTNQHNAHKERIFVPSPDEVIKAYRKWLWLRIKADDLAILHSLCQITEQTTLVCSCNPDPCHCQTVAQAARWIGQQDKLSYQMMRAGFKISYDPSTFEWEAYWDFFNGGDGFAIFTLDREGQWWLAFRTDDYGNPYPQERHPESIHFIKKWVELVLEEPEKVRKDDYRKHIFEHTAKAKAYQEEIENQETARSRAFTINKSSLPSSHDEDCMF